MLFGQLRGGPYWFQVQRCTVVSPRKLKTACAVWFVLAETLTGCGYVGLQNGEDGVSSGGVPELGGAMPVGDGDGDVSESGGAPSGGRKGGGGAESGGAPSGSGARAGSGGSEESGGAAGSGGWGGSGGRSGGGSGGREDDGSGGLGGLGGMGGGDDGICEGDDGVHFGVSGWAAEAGGTTGGKGGATVAVATGAQLIAALHGKSPDVPLTILVRGTINVPNAGAEQIAIRDVSDVSIIGLGKQAVFAGIGFTIERARNIVLRNLLVEIHPSDGPAVTISGPAEHIWIDHCEFSSAWQNDDSPMDTGLLEVAEDVQYITWSWNHLHDSYRVATLGADEVDVLDRKLTMHHNWIRNIDSGAPLLRGGSAHVFNNFFEDVATSAVHAEQGACVRVENNVFFSVRNPWNSASGPAVGGVDAICNQFDLGSVFDGADEDVWLEEVCESTPPYDYSHVLNHVTHVQKIVKENAGTGKLSDPQSF